jgi:hypothetical protein
MSLPTDIYMHIFTLTHFRLSDMINLTMVSKNLRQISLLETYWYIIRDTKKVLYNFIRKILQSNVSVSVSASVSYPFSKIRQMHSTDFLDKFNLDIFGHDGLDIMINRQTDMINFYKYFTDYQYLHVYRNGCRTLCDFTTLTTLRGINIFSGVLSSANLFHQIPTKHTITEILAPNSMFDCNILLYCPLIEKLEVGCLVDPQYLKRSRLRYLRHVYSTDMDLIISNLPDTIESLVMQTNHSLATLIDRLAEFKYLTYMKFNLVDHEFSTSLNIDTLHFIFSDSGNIRLDLPNVKNIIISNDTISRHIENLYLTSQNALTCQIDCTNIDNLITVLPNCLDVSNSESKIDYDPNIFN